MKLNKKQQHLLDSIHKNRGLIVYGRGPAETVKALYNKGLVMLDHRETPVYCFGKVEIRTAYTTTHEGAKHVTP